jgi:hypothetical protein
MSRVKAGWTLTIFVVTAGLSVAAGPAHAQGMGMSTGGHVGDSHPAPVHPIAPRPVSPNLGGGVRPPFRHPIHRQIVSTWASPVIVYAPSIAPAPDYYDPPAVYDPAPVYDSTPPAPSPAASSVIEYPTGRYELRGDGTTAPYTWVWIPNPPPAPPSAAPGALATTLPASSTTAFGQPDRLYHWTDEQGVVHLTDVWSTVPSRYQAQAKQSY